MNGKSIKLLNVGNSFSWSLEPYLKKMVAFEGKHSLFQRHCCIGGCSLEHHWECVKEFEKNGTRSYDYEDHFDGHMVWLSLQEALTREAWDVVSIQQASHFSWKPETYQPWGTYMVDYIRKYAPQAQILVQQTWAYRTDSPRLTDEWKITQQEMYKRLTAAYTKFAQEMGLPLIPVGNAIQLAREKQGGVFQPVTLEEKKAPVKPELPEQKWSFINGYYWHMSYAGHPLMDCDFIHLNARGQYLQALVWYGFLYGEDPATVAYTPQEVEASDAAFLRGIASAALKGELPACK